MTRAPSVEPIESAARLAAAEAVLLDVREPFERSLATVAGALAVPMRELPARVGELPRDRPLHVLCHHGVRSRVVADWLVAQGFDAHNVEGGIDAWATDVDASIGRY